MLGRARLERHVDHAGLAAGRRQPRRPAPPLPDQGRPGAGRGRAPDRRRATRSSSRRRAALPTRRRPHPRGARGAGRAVHRPAVRRRPRALDGRAHRRRAARGGRRRWRPGSGATRTAPPSTRSASTSRVPGNRELVQATLDLVRGLGLANPLTDDAVRRDRILDHWADTLETTLGRCDRARRPPDERAPRDRPQDPAASSPTSPSRATRSTRWSPTSTRPAGGRPTPAEGWDVATSIAHLAWTDEVAVPAATDKAALGRATCSRPSRTRRLRRRRGAAPAAPCLPTSCSPRWRAGRAAPGRGAQRPPGRGEAALVRPADEPDLDGHRPLHGDLGARPRRRRRRSASPSSRTTGSVTSSTSACAPAASPSPTTASRCPTETCASS